MITLAPHRFRPRPRPLLLAAIAALLLIGPSFAPAQPPPPPPPPGVAQLPTKTDPSIVIPQFDVISVKPNKDSNQTRMQFTPDGLRGIGVTVRFLLYEGYGGINHERVIGEPAWTSTDGFDVEAKVAPGDVATLARMTFEQRRTMFQSILADRFKLVVHHETRELPVYVLSVAKGGPKLKPSAPDDSASRRRGMMFNRGKLTANDAQLPMLVSLLSRELGRTIVDKTGLTGDYDFTLEWTPDEAAGAGPPSASPAAAPSPTPADSGPSIFTAIQEQLGLKLEAGKGPVDVVVIDQIERPSEN
jgi:uncharacterized protein (TIGR03435 family)